MTTTGGYCNNSTFYWIVNRTNASLYLNSRYTRKHPPAKSKMFRMNSVFIVGGTFFMHLDNSFIDSSSIDASIREVTWIWNKLDSFVCFFLYFFFIKNLYTIIFLLNHSTKSTDIFLQGFFFVSNEKPNKNFTKKKTFLNDFCLCRSAIWLRIHNWRCTKKNRCQYIVRHAMKIAFSF